MLDSDVPGDKMKKIILLIILLIIVLYSMFTPDDLFSTADNTATSEKEFRTVTVLPSGKVLVNQ